MENHYFVDSDKLSETALKKKHQLENDPTSRTDHMEYMEGMERIDSDIMEKVLNEMNDYDYSGYTAADVRAALSHDNCTVEDFKALLSPAAEPFLEKMAERARLETQKHFGNTVYLFTPLYIANYCENYCVYCGFNCYNDIRRMKLKYSHIVDSALVKISVFIGIKGIYLYPHHTEVFPCKPAGFADILDTALRSALACKNEYLLHTAVCYDLHLVLDLLHIQFHSPDVIIAVETAVYAVIFAVICYI